MTVHRVHLVPTQVPQADPQELPHIHNPQVQLTRALRSILDRDQDTLGQFLVEQEVHLSWIDDVSPGKFSFYWSHISMALYYYLLLFLKGHHVGALVAKQSK